MCHCLASYYIIRIYTDILIKLAHESVCCPHYTGTQEPGVIRSVRQACGELTVLATADVRTRQSVTLPLASAYVRQGGRASSVTRVSVIGG